MAAIKRAPFGAVLRRVSDEVGVQGCDVFDSLGIQMDARLVSVLLAVRAHETASSSEIAAWTGLSRQLVESRLKTLTAQKLLCSRICDDDARKRVYEISDARRAEADRIAAVMMDFDAVYEALWREIAVNLDDALLKFERAIAQRSLTERLFATCAHYRHEASEAT